MRRLLLLICALWPLGCPAQTLLHPATSAAWEDWEAFSRAFVSDDGRVVDWTDGARTVSEGQAYTLFFALVAGDRARFERVLTWTEQNLARGDLAQVPPAWLWGLRADGNWGVIDTNSATDANLWVAYSLIEAGRLWNSPDYRRKGQRLLARIREGAVYRVQRGPLLLLPAPQGFVSDNGVRINPSYYMPAQLKLLQREDPAGPWAELLRDYLRLLPPYAPLGRVSDWASFEDGRLGADPLTQGAGSYDAIRVYLWAGMDKTQPMPASFHATLKGFGDMLATLGRIPERWSIGNSGIAGDAPLGFSAALLPYFAGAGAEDQVQAGLSRLAQARRDGLYGSPARYYDHVLILFGKGFVEQRFSFDSHGAVVPRWAR